jgi:hypothetical protein
LLGIGQVEPVALLAVLEEDGRACVFEDGVAKRVAFGDFLADLDVEIVARVLGFPEAAAKVEEVAQGAVGVDVLGCSAGSGDPRRALALTWSLSLGRSVQPCGLALSASRF